MNVEHLKKYKDNCYSALSRDLTEFEKNFLLISGGILAFSITFIKDIIKVSEADYLAFLFLGWSFIIISIGIMMHTFLKAANASDLLWKAADDFIETHNLYDDATSLSDIQCKEIKEIINKILYPSKNGLRNLRKWAVNFFLLGVISFSVFVALNLIRESKSNAKEQVNSIKRVNINDTVILQNQKQ